VPKKESKKLEKKFKDNEEVIKSDTTSALQNLLVEMSQASDHTEKKILVKNEDLKTKLE
jgi:hypothetical protein